MTFGLKWTDSHFGFLSYWFVSYSFLFFGCKFFEALYSSLIFRMRYYVVGHFCSSFVYLFLAVFIFRFFKFWPKRISTIFNIFIAAGAHDAPFFLVCLPLATYKCGLKYGRIGWKESNVSDRTKPTTVAEGKGRNEWRLNEKS